MHNVRRPHLYLVLAIPALVLTATGPVAAQTPDPVQVTITQLPTPSPLLVGQTSIAKFTANVITPPQQTSYNCPLVGPRWQEWVVDQVERSDTGLDGTWQVVPANYPPPPAQPLYSASISLNDPSGASPDATLRFRAQQWGYWRVTVVPCATYTCAACNQNFQCRGRAQVIVICVTVTHDPTSMYVCKNGRSQLDVTINPPVNGVITMVDPGNPTIASLTVVQGVQYVVGQNVGTTRRSGLRTGPFSRPRRSSSTTRGKRRCRTRPVSATSGSSRT
jgi:hypothetical protein